MEIKVNSKIGDLTIIGIDKSNVLCKCKCGTVFTTNKYYLKIKQNCGCNKTRYAHNPYNKGCSREVLYKRWSCMLSRCYNQKDTDYYRYGGRGIEVCNEWKNKETGYKNFKQWSLNNGYKKELELDRINNDQGYSPDNCRWVDHRTNINNRNAWGNKYLVNGKLLPVCDIARLSNLPYLAIYGRIHYYKYKPETDITPIIIALNNKYKKNDKGV